MTRRSRAGILAATVAASCAAACGEDRVRTKEGPSTFLDVYVLPDSTCDGSPFCVSSVVVTLTELPDTTQEVCHDVVGVLGYPASSMDELAVLAGAAIADGLPSGGIVGIELRAYSELCSAVPGTVSTPVLSGYAEIEMLDEDQQLFVPVGCAQPILPCAGTRPAPTPTPCL